LVYSNRDVRVTSVVYKDRKTYPRIYGLESGGPNLWQGARLAFQKLTTRVWYQLVSLQAKEDLTFMNFGYASTDATDSPLQLEAVDECNRNTIQLYHRVVNAVDLRGKDVLEVGSGRGGGSAFISKYHHPHSMTGVDFCGKAIRFSNRYHGREGLSYKEGDAEDLPFAPDSFDAVVNVESCHCYISVDRFLEQVARVLRSGGHLLFTDMGPKPYVDALRGQLKRCSLSIIEEEDIGPNVVRALELTSAVNRVAIKDQVPLGLRRTFSNFAGIQDTPVFEALRTGEWEYVRFVLQKV
jgi:ubiquinone/menaquinone biosynthesis C-methylase UbiE